MFPEQSGVYIVTRDKSNVSNVFIVRVKGVYPSLQIDKNAVDISSWLHNGKVREVSKDIIDNIEIFHTEWNFIPLKMNFGVFSNIEFVPNPEKLYMSEEDAIYIRGKYYRLCQQGVSPMKVIRALTYELNTSKEQILNLVNEFDSNKSY